MGTVIKVETFIRKTDWALLQGFKKWRDFKGRATRLEYWVFTLTYWGLDRILMALDRVFFPNLDYGFLDLIGVALFSVPTLSISIRRLHDSNLSSWWLLGQFVTLVIFTIMVFMDLFIGLIFLVPLLYMACRKSTPGANRYGPQVNVPS